MTCGLVHASYNMPEWQAVKLTFFARWKSRCHKEQKDIEDEDKTNHGLHWKIIENLLEAREK